jgi:hypothetical protein
MCQIRLLHLQVPRAGQHGVCDAFGITLCLLTTSGWGLHLQVHQLVPICSTHANDTLLLLVLTGATFGLQPVEAPTQPEGDTYSCAVCGPPPP